VASPASRWLPQHACTFLCMCVYLWCFVGGYRWLTRGYAVLDGPTLPIVAEGDEEPNVSAVSPRFVLAGPLIW